MTVRKRKAAVKKKRIRRDPEHARAHILKAAVKVLSQYGPEAVGLKDVAREAGVSHALITHYFGTYEALVDAAVFQAMSTIRTRLLERLLATPNPTPAATAKLYLEIALEPWHGRLVGWALFRGNDRTRDFADQLQPDMKLIAAATEYMFARRSSETWSRRQTEAVIVALWSMVVGYVSANGFFWRALGRKPSPRRDRDIQEIVAILARALFP